MGRRRRIRRPMTFFEILFGTIVLITLLCGAFSATTFFSPSEELTEAQAEVLSTALEAFKFGLAAILGLLGGQLSSRNDRSP